LTRHDDSSVAHAPGDGDDEAQGEETVGTAGQGDTVDLVQPAEFDERAQACFIVFDDGDSGWCQLWRCSEHVKML
jgi:hypothetical protein